MTINDLLLGLMLPSGNDAAICLAENIGRLLRYSEGLGDAEILLMAQNALGHEDLHRFLDFMNEISDKLKMKRSQFVNPHGLNNEDNFSCCKDLGLLLTRALKSAKFREIVMTKEHSGVFFKRNATGYFGKNNKRMLQRSNFLSKLLESLLAIWCEYMVTLKRVNGF